MSAVASPGQKWITLGVAAGKLGVSVPVVRNLIRDGRLSVREVGYWQRVSAAEVDALDKQSIRPAVVGD